MKLWGGIIAVFVLLAAATLLRLFWYFDCGSASRCPWHYTPMFVLWVVVAGLFVGLLALAVVRGLRRLSGRDRQGTRSG